MQGDGNLVLYQGSSALWSTATSTAGSRAVMQGDGNLVVYSGSTAKWASRTGQYTGATLSVQDDGNLVIYDLGRAIWIRSSGYIGSFLKSDQTLNPGQMARSGNGSHRLVMQGDGNLVLYQGSSALWSTATSTAGSRAVMQGDGNLVVYSGSTAKWSSGTAGNPGAYLAVQDDGNLVMYKGSTAIWTRQTRVLQLPWPKGQTHRINSAGSGYGCDFHVGRTYYAIDFDHIEGQAVSSVADGTAQSGYHDQLGNYIWVDHGGGLVSIYAHFSSFSGSFPRKVAQGEIIGAAGNTGASQGAHLHFVMRSEATGPFDGQAFKPEPMSGYSGFGGYGCGRGTSPPYTP
jgi:murein DD-endopeptidase MepM/ murein hydrolase activator NlpD